ncbi:MAG TPA: hypothetical protein VHR66_28955 [Gemmataceae bacterium]|jgi:hypothetical protein|nr:hypothetical protein [Gemmataceae bacterium]
MTEHKPPPELPERDRLMTRPDATPLPAAQDVKEPASPADPRPIPKGGQGTDPKARDLDHTA